MPQLNLTISTTVRIIELGKANILFLANDGASDIYFDFDADATASLPPLKSGEAISYDLKANEIEVKNLSLLSASSSTVRLRWL